MNKSQKLLRVCLASAVFAAVALGAHAQQKNIYHKGWVDFNKNGKMDIFEDPAQSIDKTDQRSAKPNDR
jgi:beta-glucosidase